MAHSDKVGVPESLDVYFKPHGTWEGISLGWTIAVWITHILSERDHRQQTLSICTRQQVSERYWSVDRLALVLDALSDD
jgi:hypothetical protein